MRHTFANIFGNEVGDLAVLQKAPGHAKIETTMKYRHVLRSDVQRGLQKMTALLTGPVVPLKAKGE
jgi:site-specific recombinase XerD